MSRLRIALLLIAAVFLLHESLLYLRILVYDMQFDLLPRVGTTRTGEVIRWKKRYLSNPWRAEVQLFDENNVGYGWQPEGHPKVEAALAAVVVYSPLGKMGFNRSGLSQRLALEHTYLYRRRWGLVGASGSEQIEMMLNNVEVYRRPPGGTPAPGAGGAARNRVMVFRDPRFGECRVSWTFAGGRFVARSDDTGAVLAGIGPDGVTSGPDGASGESFGDLSLAAVALPNRQGHFWFGGRAAFVDRDAGAVFVLSVGQPQRPDTESVVHPLPARPPPSVAADEPVAATLSRVEIPGSAGELSSVNGARGFWGYSGSAGIAVAHGRELIVLDWDGEIIERTTLDYEIAQLVESRNASQGSAEERSGVGFVGIVPPINAVGMIERHLLLDRENGTTSTVVVTEPVTASERAFTSLFGLMALTRPAPLNVVAFATDGPSTWDDFFQRGVRDPLFGSGRAAGWLIASLLLAALCGWWTRRYALRQFGTRTAAARWMLAGALLGPVGVVWLRVAVPRKPVLACEGCARPRGAGPSPCPACGAGWAAPERTDAEVHA